MSDMRVHSDAAERAVISVVIQHPHLLSLAGLEPMQFYNPHRSRIWNTLLLLDLSGEGINDTTVEIAVVEGNESSRPEFIECIGTFASSGLVEQYAETVREFSLTRQTLEVLGEAVVAGRNGQVGGYELLATVQGKLASLNHGRPGKTLSMATMVNNLCREIDAAYKLRQEGADVVRGIPTGIEKWDDMGGIHFGIPTILGGRPGMGKSAVSQCVTRAAIHAGHGVHVFSMEDTQASYTSRALAREGNVGLTAIRSANLSRGDMERLTPAMGRLSKWVNFGYEPVSGITAAQLVSMVRREKERLGTRLVVVDYLQRMGKPDRRMSDMESLATNLSVIANAALEDNIAYLVLSQLNRKCEERTDKRPMMADFRGAGEIEQLGKTCVAVYRDGYYDTDRVDDTLEVLILKNNDGPIGDIYVNWDGRCTAISNRKSTKD